MWQISTENHQPSHVPVPTELWPPCFLYTLSPRHTASSVFPVHQTCTQQLFILPTTYIFQRYPPGPHSLRQVSEDSLTPSLNASPAGLWLFPSSLWALGAS